MIFGVSELMGSPGDGGIAATDVHESGGASGGSSEIGASSSIPGGGLEETERGGGGGGGGGAGSRWPSKETLALLKIRSEMDSVFRDASHKAPLWEAVSRKMGELGFQRSAKKCREKFENVYKYHKRTKDGRASKPAGKTYRFFEQLEALDSNPFSTVTAGAPPRNQPPLTVNNTNPYTTAASLPTSPTPLSVLPPNLVPPPQQLSSTPFQPQQSQVAPPAPSFPPSFLHFANSMSSSSTSSDEDIQRRRGRKRKWKDYLQKLMREVIQKQEEMQKRFLETLEKREHDRISREEAWRAQEIARLNREHEILVQERSVAATKDAAIVAFLQKITDQQNLQIPVSLPLPPFPQIPTQEQPSPAPIRQPQLEIPELGTGTGTATATREENVGGSSAGGSSSRWPKTEVHALIKLRTDLDLKYLETGPKGPLWEEISGAMAKLGYNRSAKRCKEKWENINKYYKKVKESNKKRPEDAKTCPYFHQLEAIYKEKARNGDPMAEPIMARPEQQWPPSEQNPVQNQNDLELDDDDDEDEDDGGGDGIPNPPPVSTAE